MQATDGAPSAPGFIGRLIAFSGRSPWFVVLMVLALSVWGWYSLRGGALPAHARASSASGWWDGAGGGPARCARRGRRPRVRGA